MRPLGCFASPSLSRVCTWSAQNFSLSTFLCCLVVTEEGSVVGRFCSVLYSLIQYYEEGHIYRPGLLLSFFLVSLFLSLPHLSPSLFFLVERPFSFRLLLRRHLSPFYQRLQIATTLINRLHLSFFSTHSFHLSSSLYMALIHFCIAHYFLS